MKRERLSLMEQEDLIYIHDGLPLSVGKIFGVEKKTLNYLVGI